MKLISSFVVLLILTSVLAVEDRFDPIRECGYLHRVDFRLIPNSRAVYLNENCMVKCLVANQSFSDGPETINEGFPCPLDSNGICQNGQCIKKLNQNAIRECGNIHRMDFGKLNNTGTAHLEEECSLKCVIYGNVVSTNSINQGFPCPANNNGVCRDGHCVAEAIAPTPSILLTHQLEQIDLQIVSVNFTSYTTWNYYGLYATACLGERIADGGLKCRQNCSTETINMMSQQASWHHKCHMNGPFTAKDSLLVDVRYLDPRHELGTFTQNIYSLFDHHFQIQSKTSKIVPSNFATEQTFQMKFDNKVTGDVALSIGYKLSRK